VRFFIVKKRQSGGEKKATHLFTQVQLRLRNGSVVFPLANEVPEPPAVAGGCCFGRRP